MPLDDLILEMDMERIAVQSIIRHYEKQGLIIRDRLTNLCEITEKGLGRLTYLKTRLETENNIRFPSEKLKTIMWREKKEKFRKKS